MTRACLLRWLRCAHLNVECCLVFGCAHVRLAEVGCGVENLHLHLRLCLCLSGRGSGAMWPNSFCAALWPFNLQQLNVNVETPIKTLYPLA